MKKSYIFTLILCPLFSFSQWSTISVPDARSAMGFGSFDDNLILAGGGAGLDADDEIDIYNITTKTWTTSKLSYGRQNPTIANINDKIFIMGGTYGFGNTSKRIDIYSKDFVLIDTIDLPNIVPSSILIVEDNIYFGYKDRIDVYNTNTGDISSITKNFDRRSYEMYLFKGKVYCIGGADFNEGTYFETVDIYDPVSETWTSTSLSEGRFLTSTISFNDKLFVSGGTTSEFETRSSKVDIYDEASNQWSIKDLSEEKKDIASFVLDNKVYLVGGIGQLTFSTSQVMDIYNGFTGEWTGGSLPIEMGKPKVVVQNNIAYLADTKSPISTLHVYAPTLSSTNNASELNITISPNPTSGLVYFENVDQSKTHSFNVHNLSGELVRKGILKDRNIDISYLESGIYILSLTNGKETITKRVVKI